LTCWEVGTESTFGGGDERGGRGEEGLKRVVGVGRGEGSPFGTRVEGFESMKERGYHGVSSEVYFDRP